MTCWGYSCTAIRLRIRGVRNRTSGERSLESSRDRMGKREKQLIRLSEDEVLFFETCAAAVLPIARRLAA